jgi:hypothetical protein
MNVNLMAKAPWMSEELVHGAFFIFFSARRKEIREGDKEYVFDYGIVQAMHFHGRI